MDWMMHVRKRLRGLFLRLVMALEVAALMSTAAAAQQWAPLGPDGGDVRSLAYDPRNPDRIYLGTSSGQLFSSETGGASWNRLAHLGEGEDYVLDHILISPQDGTTYVAAWSIEKTNGDIFVSHDRGRSWKTLEGMHGRSVRSLAMAKSDPKLLVAGTLEGVFRSRDGGATWKQISPEGHAEIKNIESVAVDPRNPDIIYAGTWHLPWKTTDGGLTWHSIKQGVIDDSDVFSIIIDAQNPAVVYISACSGIYKSESAGELFHKAQGIPSSARRTRVLHQDALDPNVVYAGTTAGLWKTADAGKTWSRVSAANVIVNDVLTDPRGGTHLLVATDRGGVLMSADAGATFTAANRGFTHRQVASLVAGRGAGEVLWAGVINDKEFGGVFMSHDGGAQWEQHSRGLGTRDVFVLRQLESGALLAGTNQGLFLLEAGQEEWRPANTVVIEKAVTKPPLNKGAKPRTLTTVERTELRARVFDLDSAGGKHFAATSTGLFVSNDGHTWRGGPVLGQRSISGVRATPQVVVAFTYRSLLVSLDAGAHWHEARLPDYVAGLNGVAIVPRTGLAESASGAADAGFTLWLATRAGCIRSSDAGETWEHVLGGLPHTDVMSMTYDPESRRLLATAAGERAVFESSDGGRSWHHFPADFSLRGVLPTHGRLLGVTPYDGIVAQWAAVPGAVSTAAATGARQ